MQVEDRETHVQLTLNVPYGESIPKVTQAVRDAVVDQVQNLTGLEVPEVDIVVNDISIPADWHRYGVILTPRADAISA